MSEVGEASLFNPLPWDQVRPAKFQKWNRVQPYLGQLRQHSSRRLETDPDSLTALTHHDYMERGGAESVEMIMWLSMRSALGPKVRRVHRHYYAPILTGYGLIVLESA